MSQSWNNLIIELLMNEYAISLSTHTYIFDSAVYKIIFKYEFIHWWKARASQSLLVYLYLN